MFLRGSAAEGPGAGRVAVITVDGEEAGRYPLSEDATIPLDRFAPDGSRLSANVLQIRDGEVRMLSSDCANQLCVHTGPVYDAGQTIVCLPHRIVVTIADDRGGPVDITTH